MELDQIYNNASVMFQNDPELRNLLMRTLDSANETGLPAIMQPPSAGHPAYPATPRIAQAGMAPTFSSPEYAPTPNTGMKRNPLVPAGPNPPQPEDAVPNSPGGGGGGIPGIIPTAAAAPRAPTPGRAVAAPPMASPSTGQSIAAFLQGLGSSDAILPAIGGGMAAVENLERQSQVRNQTVRALMARGLDAESAAAAAQNPEILKAVLPSLFGGKKQLGEIYDAQGNPQKVFYDDAGNVENVGGSRRDPGTSALTRVQATANVKRVEKFKGEADSAREMLGTLNQLTQARKSVPDWIKGLPPGIGGSLVTGTDYFGVTQGAKALAPQELSVQLGFTERTKGAITDREMGMFAQAVPGLGMTDVAADKVVAGMQAAAQRKIEQSKFYEGWLSKNKGDLNGAQDAWDAYINANPIIALNPDGTLTVNKANIGNWRDYVAGGDEDPRASEGPAGGDVNIQPRGGDATAGGGRELPGAGGQSGFSTTVRKNAAEAPDGAPVQSREPGQQSQQSGPRPRISTPEEYQALAPGTKYYDANGTPRTKR